MPGDVIGGAVKAVAVAALAGAALFSPASHADVRSDAATRPSAIWPSVPGSQDTVHVDGGWVYAPDGHQVVGSGADGA